MVSGLVIVVIIFVVLLALAIGALVLLGYFKSRPSSVGSLGTGITGSLVGFTYSCKNGELCASDLVCDASTVTCRRAPGTPCSSYSDCPLPYFCSGICVTGAYGGTLNYCPCPAEGLQCVTLPDSNLNVCKIQADNFCQTNDQCVSNQCEAGVCTLGIINGEPCQASYQCTPNSYCDTFGFCQPTGVLSGTVGSVCFPEEPPPGTPGASAAGCDIGNACFGGFCRVASQGLGNACSVRTLCTPLLICGDNSSGGICGPESQSCSCGIPYGGGCPNGVCGENMSCVAGVCRSEAGQGCNNNTQCVEGTFCRGQGMVYVLGQGNIPNPINPGVTGLPGSTELGWLPHSSVPQGLIFQRLTGYTNGVGQEIIYGVSNSGLYQYNSNGWSLLIPSTSSKVLLDAAATPNLTLLAFLEGNNYTLYSLNPTQTLTPFNMTSGTSLPIQFTPTMTPISINGLDISLSQDVLLLNNSTPLIKSSSVTTYTPRNQTTVPLSTPPNSPLTNLILPRFYFDVYECAIGPTGPYIVSYPPDVNFSFVSPLISQTPSPPPTGSQLLQFNGNVGGAYYPTYTGAPQIFQVIDYSIFSPYGGGSIPIPKNACITGGPDESSEPAGMIYSSGLVVSNVVGGNPLIYFLAGGTPYLLPGYPNSQSRVLTTSQRAYWYTVSSCG